MKKPHPRPLSAGEGVARIGSGVRFHNVKKEITVVKLKIRKYVLIVATLKYMIEQDFSRLCYD
jgi:hypothetical protein